MEDVDLKQDFLRLKMNFKKRTPEEIDEYLGRVADIWKRNPHLRLGQLIMNVDFDHDMYNVWDEELFKRLEELYDSR
jgi:hypothetical protein